MRSIDWVGDKVRFIDQTKLPNELDLIETDDYKIVADAIKKLKIRGAPAIGIAAGFGIYLGVKNFEDDDKENLKVAFQNVCDVFAKTRPTAVNLFWAIERMKKVFYENLHLELVELKKKLLVVSIAPFATAFIFPNFFVYRVTILLVSLYFTAFNTTASVLVNI